MSIIYNLNRDGNSLQVSLLKDIPAGDFQISQGQNPALIKNITNTDLVLEVKLARNSDYVSTVFYPGWNPELVVAIKGVTENTLQYGN